MAPSRVAPAPSRTGDRIADTGPASQKTERFRPCPHRGHRFTTPRSSARSADGLRGGGGSMGWPASGSESNRHPVPVQPYVPGSVSVVDGPRRDVVARARRGDVLAFEALIQRYRPINSRSLAYRLLGDRDRMDDAMQEAYLKAFRALRGFAGNAPFGAWLFRIVYNACMDQPPYFPFLGARSRLVFEPSPPIAAWPDTAGTWPWPWTRSRRTSGRWSCWWTRRVSTTAMLRRVKGVAPGIHEGRGCPEPGRHCGDRCGIFVRS